MRADCLHYFGVDILRSWSHEALPLIARVHHFWAVDLDADPPRWRSAIHAGQAARQAEAEASEAEAAPLIGAGALVGFGGEYRRG